jgi:hypothetical protein
MNNNHPPNQEAQMYLTLFFDQCSYEFNVALHPSRTEAEVAYKALLRRFDCKPCSGGPADDYGEGPHIYRLEADGKLGEEIDMAEANHDEQVE